MSASDRDVVGEVRRGDRDAFGELVQRYQGRLFGLVLMMVREPSGAEEVTQDAFVRAHANINRYDDGRPFYPWLAAIAVRLAQNWLRRHGRVVRREGAALELAAEPAAAAATLTALIEGEGTRRLWRAVAALPSGQRTVVMLYYRDEMAVGAVARARGGATGAVTTLVLRARRQLRERLQDAGRSDENTAI